MKTKKLKYNDTTPIGIKAQSFVGIVRENDIIDVNATDYKRLKGKVKNGKPLFSDYKEQKTQEETPEKE